MEDLTKKISYFLTEEVKCPICTYTHRKEEMLTGGGRLIAGNMTTELRRLYKTSPKFGSIVPNAYTIQVCPQCLYASFPKDFSILKPTEIDAIKKNAGSRSQLIKTLSGPISYREPRNLVLGAGSYLLAIDCYHFRGRDVAPTPKKAVASMRASWLLEDLFEKANYRPYDKVRDFYYMEACRYYADCLEIMQSGLEPIDQHAYVLGPDLDHNWGYDGVIYLNSFLTQKFIDHLGNTTEEKLALLEKSKLYLSKLYGTGKSSKAKPSVIVDMAKDLYDELGQLIEKLQGPTASSQTPE